MISKLRFSSGSASPWTAAAGLAVILGCASASAPAASPEVQPEPEVTEPAATPAQETPAPGAVSAAAPAVTNSSGDLVSTDGAAAASPAAATTGSSAEPPKRPGLTVAETRTTAVIQAVVAQNRAKVRSCYESALTANPKLRGTLTVHFTIDEDGKVTAADINGERTTLHVPAVQQCALAAVRQIAFPKSSRGFESTVNYPFDFRPAY